MARQVKTNAKDVKAKQAVRTNGAAHPQEQDPEATKLQALADLILVFVTEKEESSEGTISAHFTDARNTDGVQWTEAGVRKALDLLEKEELLFSDLRGARVMVRLWNEETDRVAADPFRGEPEGVAEGDLEDAGAVEEDDDDPGPNSGGEPAQMPVAANGTVKAYEYRPTRYLLHTFTPDEINGFRADREEKDRVIDDLDAELESHQEKARSLKKRIDTLTDEGRLLSRRVREGSEYRNVPCEERKEPDPREDSETRGVLMMCTYRLDTMEIVEVRELRGAERQGQLFHEAPAPTPAVGNEIREATAQ